MKVRKKDIRKWVEALRSGEYKQTIGELQNNVGHCCLGVACEIFIQESKKRRYPNNMLIGTSPNDQKYAPNGLKK